MIIDDTHQFVFVHIPKCAGSSVHAQLSLFDARDPASHRGGVHPVLGPIHFAHIPLRFLRDHFPAEFAKLGVYRSFALTRDPRARFVSATVQHLREFRGRGPGPRQRQGRDGGPCDHRLAERPRTVLR